MNIKEYGDLIFTNGELTEVDELKDIEQNIRSIFNTRKGEFFLDIDYGFNYTNLETKGSSDTEIYADILDAVSQEERVTEIIDITIERDRVTRQVKIHLILGIDTEELDMEVVI